MYLQFPFLFFIDLENQQSETIANKMYIEAFATMDESKFHSSSSISNFIVCIVVKLKLELCYVDANASHPRVSSPDVYTVP